MKSMGVKGPIISVWCVGEGGGGMRVVCKAVKNSVSLCRSSRPSHALQNTCEQKSCRQSKGSP